MGSPIQPTVSAMYHRVFKFNYASKVHLKMKCVGSLPDNANATRSAQACLSSIYHNFQVHAHVKHSLLLAWCSPAAEVLFLVLSAAGKHRGLPYIATNVWIPAGLRIGALRIQRRRAVFFRQGVVLRLSEMSRCTENTTIFRSLGIFKYPVPF